MSLSWHHLVIVVVSPSHSLVVSLSRYLIAVSPYSYFGCLIVVSSFHRLIAVSLSSHRRMFIFLPSRCRLVVSPSCLRIIVVSSFRRRLFVVPSSSSSCRLVVVSSLSRHLDVISSSRRFVFVWLSRLRLNLSSSSCCLVVSPLVWSHRVAARLVADARSW